MEQDVPTREYEISYFVTTPEAEAELLAELKKCGIAVSSKTELAPRTLAYPILKQTSAFFGCAKFVAAPEAIAELRTSVRHLSGLLRHLVVHSSARPVPTRVPGSSRAEDPPTPDVAVGAPVPKIEPAALSNEALEKKLKEML